MTIYIIFPALTSFFAFLLGYLVYRSDKHSDVKRLYGLMNVLLGLWALIAIFVYSTDSLRAFAVLFRIGFAFQLFYVGSVLHFALVVTELAGGRKRLLWILYIPCVVSILLVLFSRQMSSAFSHVDGVWQCAAPCDHPEMVYFLAVRSVWFSAAAVVFLLRARFSVLKNERRVFLIMGMGLVVIFCVTGIEALVLPAYFDIPWRGLDFLLKFAWLLCIGFLIDRYDLLRAPERLEDAALTELPGYLVVLVDRNRRIHRLNREAERFFAVESAACKGDRLSALIPAAEEPLADMECGVSDGIRSISCIVDATDHSGSGFRLDMKVSVVFDRQQQAIGYVAVARPHICKGSFCSLFNLSSREIEVIEEIISGRTNSEIAERLHISEKTVKSHITHLFTKLDVSTRIQLFSLLRKHHYISEHTADKHRLLIVRPAE